MHVGTVRSDCLYLHTTQKSLSFQRKQSRTEQGSEEVKQDRLGGKEEKICNLSFPVVKCSIGNSTRYLVRERSKQGWRGRDKEAATEGRRVPEENQSLTQNQIPLL